MDQLSEFLNTEEKDDEESKVYIGSGLSCLHGATYQLKLLMLFLLRAINNGYTFYLATEIDAAEKFDDVVFQFIENDVKVHVFLQAKHKQDEERRITVEDLINKSGKAEYYLPKYFISYLKIKHNSDFTDSVLRDFILCTNIELDLDPATADDEVKRVQSSTSNQISDMFVVIVEGNNHFFGDRGSRYRFSYHSNMISVLKHTFEETLKEEIKELKRSRGRLQNRPEPHLTKKLNQIQQWLGEFEQMTSGNVEEEMKQFFDTLVLAVGQPNETMLTQIIKSELSQEFDTFNSNYAYARYHEVMLDWLKDRRGYFLTQDDGSKLFDQLREEILGHFLFNVLSPVESFFGRDEELKTLHKLINQDGPAVISQETSISGLGGIGKTELVRKYLSEYSEHYDNILWINAETHETMEASFKELAAEVLGVAFKDLDIKSVLRKTYSYFSKRNCLFVFDNADTLKSKDGSVGISEVLPSSFIPRDKNTPKVLITSRNNRWGSIPQLVLKTFEEREALDFIKIQLEIEDESQDSDIRNLAQILQYFPLALQQAVAYIKEKRRAYKNIGSEFKTIDYIKIYEEEAKNLLDYNFPEDSRDLYTKTTYTIMKITIIKIKENKEYGEIAGGILDIIALLAPDNIPVEIFFELDLIKNNKDKLSEAIQLLKQYSLINTGQTETQLNVHRLVQQVTKIIQQDQNKEFFTFEVGFKILKDTIIKQENYTVTRHLLTHTESFLLNLDRWLKSNPESELTMDLYFLELLPSLTNKYHDLGNCTGQKKIQERALEINEKYFGRNHFLVASTLVNLGNAYGNLGDHHKKKELLERAFEIEEKHYGKNHFEVAPTLDNLGNAYGDLGDQHKKKELLELALEIKEKHYGTNHFEVATTLLNLGCAYGDLGDQHKKKELLERAFEIEEKHYGRNHFKVATTLGILGCAYGELGDQHKKKELLERAFEIEEKHYGRNHFEVASTLSNLGCAYGDLGDHQKTKELLERALEIKEKHYGRNHINVASLLVNLGCAYGALGDQPKKKELLEQALKIEEKYYGRNHFEVAKTLNDLGCAYGALGDQHKKKELLERALEIKEKHYGRNNFEVASTLVNLGCAYGALGDQPKKKEFLERALVIDEKHYGRNHFKVATTLDHLGCAYGDLGDHQKTKELYERALDIIEKHYGRNHIKVASLLVILGWAYGNLGDQHKNKELLERALVIEEKHFGKNNFKVTTTLVYLGCAYGALGDHPKAKELLESSLEIKDKHYGRNHLEVAVILHKLSIVYSNLGEPQIQKELLERALEIEEKHYGRNHLEVAKTLHNLGCAYGDLGDQHKKKELFERALEIQEKL